MSTPCLEIRSLRKAWASRVVLSDISLSLDAGEHALVQGPSGAGKSTLLGVIARLIPPDAGEVRLDGAAIQTLGSPSRYRR
ncbi:MAG: ATP-binding cassette domain-containing protein, partial [Myxococcota bacterium]|nr:ATP-binding cassette domain-containing protein [Myxococcota bacterium]